MVSLVSDTNSTCQIIKLFFYLVMESGFMIWKVVLWFILDVNSLNRLDLRLYLVRESRFSSWKVVI